MAARNPPPYLAVFFFPLNRYLTYNQNMPSLYILIFTLILATQAVARMNIVIDPGHGGIDGGTTNGRYKESVLVLAIAQLIEKKVEQDFNLASQINIKLTRSKDQHMNLVDRIVPQFEEEPTDLFLSLHLNSSVSKRANGMEVYFDTTRPLTKLSRSAANSEEKILNEILVDLSESGRHKWSQLFAETLREQWTVSSSKVRRVPFFVLNNNSAPSVLIEAGYLSNENESKLLSQKEHQEVIADKIIKSLLTYKQIAYK